MHKCFGHGATVRRGAITVTLLRNIFCDQDSILAHSAHAVCQLLRSVRVHTSSFKRYLNTMYYGWENDCQPPPKALYNVFTPSPHLIRRLNSYKIDNGKLPAFLVIAGLLM